jgi:DNA-binding NarL/FixJ family response regulator
MKPKMQMRILLASHDNLIRCTQREVLELCGYTVAGEASTAEAAIQKFSEVSPNFVVLDFHPEDFDVIKAIKEMQVINNDIMIIVNSSWVQHSQMNKAIQLGIKDWVPNTLPNNPGRFMTAVDLLIGDAHRLEIQERILASIGMRDDFNFLRKTNIYGL